MEKENDETSKAERDGMSKGYGNKTGSNEKGDVKANPKRGGLWEGHIKTRR